MEFWGVEVKSGQSLPVEVGDDSYIRFTHACLGEMKKDKGNKSVCLYLKIGQEKFVLGTLSPENCPQFTFELIFENDFELSHNWKHGSVFFCGYKVPEQDESDSVPGEEAKSESKKKVKIVEPTKDEKPNEDNDSDDADDSSYTQESDDQHTTSDGEDDESDSDEDEDEDEEAPRMIKDEQGKKRSAEPAKKTPLFDKKAKFETPQKTDGKKVAVHVATPHPSKQIGKTPASSSSNLKDQSEKPFPCASCSRSFGTEFALQSHSKAKHSAT